MPSTFGSFEVVREVYADPTYKVYEARKPGQAVAEFAVKVFSIQPSEELDSESAAALAPLMGDIERSYTQRIAIQKQAAALSPFILPILETGQDDRGVWYA